eukprot:3085819-Heterocapsa_arctica.AAC.1
MIEKLGNKTHMEHTDNLVTSAYAQSDKVTHRGNSLKENIEIDFTNKLKFLRPMHITWEANPKRIADYTSLAKR